MKLAANVVHGTLVGYNYHRCRCAECADAVRNYNRAYRKSSAARQEYEARVGKRNRRRNTIAAQWLRANRPDVWQAICEQAEK